MKTAIPILARPHPQSPNPRMKPFRRLALSALLGLSLAPLLSHAAAPVAGAKPTIVLVHGAFADAGS